MTSAATGNSIQEFSTDLLRVYYDRLFPYDAMYSWFSYGLDPHDATLSTDEREYFFRREWSFTIEDDIYIRYQCFRDQAEFAAAIKKRQPHKIDIGAVFTAPPKDHTTINPDAFKPVERELVFDVDMDDYKNRQCCTGAKICHRCWPFMTMAIKVVDCALREDFGFRNILWIYSGRRGVHCWVCDPEARELANEAREAVVSYLAVDFPAEGDEGDKRLMKTFQTPMHPSLARAYNTVEPMFGRYICHADGQGLLKDKVAYMKVLNKLPNEDIRKELYGEWERNPLLTGEERWEMMRDAITEGAGSSASQAQKKRKVDYSKLDAWKHEFVLNQTYPRLDVNVSKHRNHLLKSPFCVHPKTGRVCIPIDPTKADTFDPFSVPTVRVLEEQINAYDRDPSNPTDTPDLDKTDLAAAIRNFESTFLEGLKATVRKQARDRADRRSAMQVDF